MRHLSRPARVARHMARLACLPALVVAGAALASAPGEVKTGPQTAGVSGAIHHEAPRVRPMTALTYEVFEATVEHADLAECPAALAHEGRFCRLVLQNDALHVFAFAEDGDQPLQALVEYPMEAIRFPD